MNDPITQVNDRPSFIHSLNNCVLHANENKKKLALLIISLNRLLRINEIYDYKTGDATLKYLADKLKEAKREQDTVGRISGSTFGLILYPVMNKGHAQLAAHKILRLLEIPLEFNDQRINLDITIGMSLCPAHSSLATGLLKKAEAAIRLAQIQEAKLLITEDFASDDITEFWDIELGIEQAIINSEFELYYQPKICLKTGLPTGAEALIRWPHPTRGMIFPDQFIPVAEDHGHIKPMTIWILNVALRESTQWTTKWGKISLSVNIPPDLMNEDLVDLVENALNIWQPENVTLVLEILERSFALSNDESFSTFKALQNLGTEISIDDFGTGYSALSYFKSIPARELKIDKSFIQHLLEEKGNFDIVTFIIKLAHAFNMRIVAEGVEDTKALTILKTFGCDYIQGYIVAKPMPHDDFVLWLENYRIEDQAFAHLYSEQEYSEQEKIVKEESNTINLSKQVNDSAISDNDKITITESISPESYDDKVEDLSDVFENIDDKVTPAVDDVPELELIDIQTLAEAKNIKKDILKETNNEQVAQTIEIIDSLEEEKKLAVKTKNTTPSSLTKTEQTLNDINFGDTII